MARPSRNVDVLLLKAGRELFPQTGAAGLSVRKVAERAGVNLGMFHYHFGTKDEFVRRLLQQLYDDMFANLELAASGGSAVDALRSALCVLGRFARDHADLLRRLLIDALAGEPQAGAFLRANVHRHLGVIRGLIEDGQRAGALRQMAPVQALAFVAGSVAAPLLVSASLRDRALAKPGVAGRFAKEVASDAAIVERADCALAGLAAPPARAARSRSR